MSGAADSDGNYSLRSGISLTLDEGTAAYLRESVYDAVLEFKYDDDSYSNISITAGSLREAPEPIGTIQGDYSIVAKITKDSSGEERSARVPVYRENVSLTHCGKNGSDFWFSGSGTVSDISLTFEVMSLPLDYMKKAFWVTSLEETETSVSEELLPASDAPSEFVICACLMQEDKTVYARIYSSDNLSEGVSLSLPKEYAGEDAVLRIFTWDSADGMKPLDSVFEYGG